LRWRFAGVAGAFAWLLFNVDFQSFVEHPEGHFMNCHDLAVAIERYQPTAPPRDVARLCLLLTNTTENLDALQDDTRLADAWQEMGLRLQAATDQHAAMTEELEQLAQTDVKTFTAEQVWVLIRAIKVQSQILQLYLGRSPLEV
jgi:hypothetical protein